MGFLLQLFYGVSWSHVIFLFEEKKFLGLNSSTNFPLRHIIISYKKWNEQKTYGIIVHTSLGDVDPDAKLLIHRDWSLKTV